jgi:hypothetical protein
VPITITKAAEQILYGNCLFIPKTQLIGTGKNKYWFSTILSKLRLDNTKVKFICPEGIGQKEKAASHYKVNRRAC